MSGTVIKLKFPPQRGLAASPRTAPRFYCKSCDNELFFITEKLDIGCGNCKAIIVNLRVERQ